MRAMTGMDSLGRTLLLAAALAAAPSVASSLTLSGTVRDQRTHSGVSGIVVKLIPPRSSSRPDLVTSTNPSGGFLLRGIEPGPYLFEVAQGTTVLFRERISLERDTQKDVELRR
ncbi:MAG TPA: carboxypeptidase-like regulatory domain-containing protein [Vicinamibacteria bacterium]|nr:carboxypeptidase-like regulatory domain-containing protein [Vicinamibacteria bacterium]